MLCKHCGYEIKEGAAFCQKCGAKVSDMLEQVTPEQPMTEPVFDAQKPKKSKKRGWILAASIAGALAILIAAGIFLGPRLWPETFQSAEGWARKNFGSGDDYLQYVEKNATQKAADRVVNAYGKYLDSLENQNTSGAVEVSAQLKLGEQVKTLLKENGAQMNLDWFQNATLKLDANTKDAAARFLLALSLNDTEIASADLLMDLDANAMYLAFLPLSENYLQGSFAMDDDTRQLLSALSSADMKDVLPTKETVAALVDKYSKLIYESLQNAEKTSETLEIAGVQQKVTVLNVSLDFQTVKQMAKTVLETLEDDAVIKESIEKVAEHLEQKGYITDADQVYENFLDSIKEAKDNLNEAKSDDSFEKLAISFYVDDAHEIVGVKYKFDSDVVYCATARDGDKFAFKLDADDLQIIGTGTETEGVVNAEYTVEAEGKAVCTIALKELSCKEGLLNGKILVTPSATLLKQIGWDATSSSVMSLINPSVELVFVSQTDSAKLEINLVSGENLLVGLAVTTKAKEATDITMPDPNQITPESGAEQWLYGLDVNSLYDKLIAAGVPEDLAGRFIQGFQQGLQPDGDGSQNI